MKKVSEKQVQRAIMDYLAARKVFHWRNNSGFTVASYKGKTRAFRYGAVGSGDIFAIAPDWNGKWGRFITIEVKAPGKVPSVDQFKWMNDVEQAGGIAMWCDSIDDFIIWWEDHFGRGK